MEKNVKVGVSLPWLSIAIGALSGWVATNTANGLAVGAFCGIIISIVIYAGLLPGVGLILYDLMAKALFTWLDVNLPILYWYGFIFAAIYTVVVVIVVIKWAGDR